jgi:hypothetical protein
MFSKTGTPIFLFHDTLFRIDRLNPFLFNLKPEGVEYSFVLTIKMYRPEICLQIFVCNLVISFYLILSLYYHIEAELGSAEEQPNKEYI